jgi:hypothetical protein
MAKKLFKGLMGGGKKKAAEAAAPVAEAQGPIITPLGGTTPTRRRRTVRGGMEDTILSEKLGS